MMRSIPLLSLTALLGAAPSHPVTLTAPSAVATDREIWTVVIGYVTAAAEQVPDSSYSYRPVPTVRTFGQIIAHIARGQDVFSGPNTWSSATTGRNVGRSMLLVIALHVRRRQQRFRITSA